ncbi:MAG TPA: hypothetical protein VGI58_19670 [Streptosporangiaceae bacterium]
MTDAFAAGDRYLLKDARLLERRLFATCFLGQPAGLVVDALRGYQNPDGGFGHALEPDTRCPASLPIYVEIAFRSLAVAAATGQPVVAEGSAGRDMVLRACDYLAAVADKAGVDGGVPPAFPVIESFPRAEHWTEWTYQPGLNPTAGLVGLLYQLGVDHPWRDSGTAYCWRQLEADGLPGDAHALVEVLAFLEQVPDQDRAVPYVDALAAHLPSVAMLHLDPDAEGYGLTPVDLAPDAGSRWRSLFGDKQIDVFLDRLVAGQQDDGGWPITWEPPSTAAVCEWRGFVTLNVLRTLTSYGRLTSSA